MTVHADDQDLDVVLLERYCSGTASPEERVQMDDWFHRNPEQSRWYAQLRAGLNKGAFPQMSAERSQAIREEIIRAALRRRPGGGETQPQGREGLGRIMSVGGFKGQPLLTRNFKKPFLQGTITSTFVAALLVVMAWVGATHYVRQSHHVAPAAYVTANGQRATIVLPDGSTVLLNVASQLQVPADFRAGSHMVRLVSGEAMFTVSHHDQTPFTVLVGKTVVRVLGTTFLVRHYVEDTATTIVVRDGKVGIGTMVVSAAQSVVVNRGGMTHILPARASQFSFATGILVLHGLRLVQAIPELDRWYDADIRLADSSLANFPIDGEIMAGSLGDLTERLRVAFNVRVVRSGRVLTLYPQ